MLRNMWNITFKYADCYRECFSGEIFDLIKRTINSLSNMCIFLALTLLYRVPRPTKVPHLYPSFFSVGSYYSGFVFNKPNICFNLVRSGGKCRNLSTVSSLRVLTEAAKVSSIRHKLYDNYQDITFEVINNLLVNQGVSITPEILEKINSIPSVMFDLPICDQIYPSLAALVGRPQSKGWKSGVYIFTHKPSGSKYVGSSNNLSRRLDQYFTFKHIDNKNSGKFLPFLQEEGFSKFSLEILVMPEELSTSYCFLFLEQYHLLHKQFDLNVQRIVNFRVNQGNKVYLYDIEGKTLYYTGNSFNQLQGDLGIHFNTYTKCVKKGQSYLNFFLISHDLLESVKKSNLTLLELNSLIAEKQTEYNVLKGKSMTENLLKVNHLSIALVVKEVATGKIWEFSSLTVGAASPPLSYLKVSRQTIAKYLNTGKLYKGYIFLTTDS